MGAELIPILIAGISAAGSIAGPIFAATRSQPRPPTIMPPPVPPGPAPDLTSSDIASRRPGTKPTAPNWLGLPAGMTGRQELDWYAANATNSNDSRFHDEAAKDWYKNTLLYNYTPGMQPSSYTAQLATNVFGRPIRNPNNPESIYSAILNS